MSPSRAYLLFSAAHGMMFTFHAATYVPFLQSIGLSLGEISWINGWFWTAIIIFELLTGMWADSHSRAWTLRMGFLFFIIGNLTYLFADDLWSALTAELLNGLGFAFLSGIQQAWVVDALKRHNREHEKGEVFANAAIVKGLLAAPTAIMGSWIGAAFGLRSPWIPTTIAAIAGMYIVVRYMNGDGEVDTKDKISEWEALKRSVKALHFSPALRFASAVGLVSNLVVAFNHYWPTFFEQYVSIADLAYVWSPLYLALFVAGFIIRRSKIASGAEAKGLAFSLVAAGVGLAAMGSATGLGSLIAIGLIHEVGRGAFRPLLDSYTNHHVRSEYRATYGSLQSLIEEVGAAIILFSMSRYMAGREDSVANVTHVWLVAGGLLVVLAIILYALKPRERPSSS